MVIKMIKKDFLYLFSRLRGYAHKLLVKFKKELEMAIYLLFPVGKKVIIPGTPEHRNLGDSAIVIAERKFFERYGIPTNRIKEITFSEYRRHRNLIRWLTRKNVIIAQLGGGNMGDQWLEEEKLHRELLIDFPENNQIIFPQTIFYTSTVFGESERLRSVEYYNARKKLILFSREKRSFKIMKSLYPETPIFLAPDIVLSVTKDIFEIREQQRNEVLLCLRNDVERSMTQAEQDQVKKYLKLHNYCYVETDMYSDCPITKDNRAVCVNRKMNEFASVKIVITDRLHGMIFSAITGTPCIAFGNYNYKVEGTYEWIKYLGYIRFVDTVDEMEKIFPELILLENCDYDNTPLLPYFEKIADILKQWEIFA